MPLRAACSAARWAAKAVPFREPLKPTVPALAEAMTLPWGSVILTRVLLKVEWIYARPCTTVRRSRRRDRGLVMDLLHLLLASGTAAAAGNGSPGPLSSSGIGPGPLPVRRKPASVTETSVGTDLDQTPDVLVNFAAQVPLRYILPVHYLPDPVHLSFAELIHPRRHHGVDLGLDQYLQGHGGAYAVNTAQCNVGLFPVWYVYTSDTNHFGPPLANMG
jgi:hypothetical protein